MQMVVGSNPISRSFLGLRQVATGVNQSRAADARLASAGGREDTAGDVAGGVPAGRPTLGVGSPAVAITSVGAQRAAAPFEDWQRIGRARPGRRVRRTGLASDPRRVGRRLRAGRRYG